MTVPTFTDCAAVKVYINRRIREIYIATDRPDGFSFDIEGVVSTAYDPYTAEIITRAGAERFATRLALLGFITFDGAMN